jgi:glycosyltransferase involved in cell wall biosynthesis
MSKLLYISDLDLQGSGYFNISVPLCTGLATKYGYDIKVAGLSYKREEHNFPFSILPAQNLVQVDAMVHNLDLVWGYDAIIFAGDLTWQSVLLRRFQDKTAHPKHYPYIGIFPVENPPLCMEFAMTAMQMDKQLCLSRFGTEECNKMGVPAQFFPIGVDTESWKQPTAEEQVNIRKALGFEPDDFIILTVADNQERKNLGRAMEVVSAFRKKYKGKIKYVLVTRENTEVGWKLRTFASRQDIGISDVLRIYERGLDFKQLWSLYAIANVFFLPSRAEGLGIPVLEAMSVGVPCLTTDCCAFTEHLEDGRGYLVKPDFVYPDVFGNADRYMVGVKATTKAMLELAETDNTELIAKARQYVVDRTWEKAVDQLHNTIVDLLQNKETQNVQTQ